ncbi:MAG: FAD-dependent monooxygenase [Proteobacteria bacterium]|nr:FAD-dependent monooxygenase [Pseudomonadota bacterium]
MGQRRNCPWWCAAALLLAALQTSRTAWGREAPLAHVIGGGPAGLASASALAEAGWRVHLYQHHPEAPPRQHLAVVGLNTARWLASQGCQALQPVSERGVFDLGALRLRRVALAQQAPPRDYPDCWIAGASTHLAPIAAIEAALRERAASRGVTLLSGKRVLDVRAEEGGSRLVLEGSPDALETPPAQLVVDASGRGSRLPWSGQVPPRDEASAAKTLSSWMSLARFDAQEGAPRIVGSDASQGQRYQRAHPGQADLLLFRVADPRVPNAVVVGGVQRYRDGRGQLSVEHPSRRERPTADQRDALLLAVMRELGLDGNALQLETAATFWAGLSRLSTYWNRNPFAPIVVVGDRAIEPHLRMGSGVSSAAAAAVLVAQLAAALNPQDRSSTPDAVRMAVAAFERKMALLADRLVETAAAYLPAHESWLNAFVPRSFAVQD